MIIKTKRVSSRNNTDNGNRNSEVKVEEKKAPGFREKKTTTSSVSTSTGTGGRKPIISQSTKDTIRKSVDTIKDGLKDSVSAVKGVFENI